MTGNKNENKNGIVQYIKEVNAELCKETKESNEVTELQMHKILFFLYGRFYNQYKIEL